MQQSAAISSLSSAGQSAPALSPTHSELVEQAYDEYCDRLQAGEAVDGDLFCAQFPAVRSRLAGLIAAHHFLAENSHLLEDALAAEPHWPQAGEMFLGFRLEQELGRGAFARVFRGTDPARGGKVVSVKLDKRGGTEGQLLGPLEHRHIVPVHSVQRDDATGLTAICMPYRGRATLLHVLDHVGMAAQPPLRAAVILEAAQDPRWPTTTPPAAVLRQGSYVDGVCYLGLRLAEALAYLHEHNIYHRDLKPSNILLPPDGEPQLIDFNLAVNASDGLGLLGGTLLYMPPEQLQALMELPDKSATAVDARSDVFSLGVILYELLTGQHPFGPLSLNLSSQELGNRLLRHQQQGCRPVRSLRPDVPVAVAKLVERCLTYRQEDRLPSAAALAQGLRHHLSLVQCWRRRLSRHSRQILAVGVLLTASLTAGVTVNQQVIRPRYYNQQVQQVRTAYQQANFSEAAGYLTQLIVAFPAEPRLRLARGQVRLEQGLALPAGKERKECWEQARLDFLAVEKELAGDLWQNICWGNYFRCKEDWQKAREYYQSALTDPNCPAEVANNHGYIADRQADFDVALASLSRAIQQNSHLQAAYHNRAMTYYSKSWSLCQQQQLREQEQACLERAATDIAQTLKLGPASGELYKNAAAIHASLSRVYLSTKQDDLNQRFARLAAAELRQAVALGIAPGPALQQDCFKLLCPLQEFQAIARQQPGSSDHVRAVLLLDHFLPHIWD